MEKRKAMIGWESIEGKERCVDGNVQNGEGDEWMRVWRRERAMCGWHCWKGKGNEWMGV